MISHFMFVCAVSSRCIASLLPALPGNPPWPEKEGVVRRLCVCVPRTKVALCLRLRQLSSRTTLRVSLLPTRGANRLRVYSLAKPHPLLVLLALCWCGLRLHGATSAIKERCLLYQCSSHLLTLSIHTHEIECCIYIQRACN